MKKEDRVRKAVELFMQGYNCSQSVVGAFSDLYGIDHDTAFRMSASFGAGIGRMRETCGAACGMFMLAGLEKSNVVPDMKAKAENYKLVQELANEFKKRNGSICCGVLLGIKKDETISNIPESRTNEYYKKRPCVKMVEEAARIWLEYYNKKEEKEKKNRKIRVSFILSEKSKQNCVTFIF